MVLSDSKTYSEHWDAESEQYARVGSVVKRGQGSHRREN